MTQIESDLDLNAALTKLSGIGPKRAADFASAFGIEKIGQLLCLMPNRYESPAVLIDGQDLQQLEGQKVRLTGTVTGLSIWSRGRRKSTMTVRLITEQDQKLSALFFNQGYRKNQFPEGRVVQLEGQILIKNGVQIIAPKVIQEGEEVPKYLQPIYPERDPVGRSTIERAVTAAQDYFAFVSEPLPEFMLQLAQVPSLPEALQQLHKPRDLQQAEAARRRLALGEVLNLERRRRASRATVESRPLEADDKLWQRILQRLPFELNSEQTSVLTTFRQELDAGQPMRRLLHGEVGSGKTAVAFALALAVAAGGGQVALLAPTEILARQHMATFQSWLQGARLKVVGLLGDDRAAARRETLAALRTSRAQIAIGTHALFSADVAFQDLRLVVLDEQHRFGVRQKASLINKGEAPHVLTMTATPIPRTMAWAQYGSLDPCILRSRAGTSGSIKTRVSPQDSWQQIAKAQRPLIEAGAQSFVVVPHIDSEDGLLAWQQRYLQGPWKGLRAGMVHGRLAGEQTAKIVGEFRDRKLDLLFGTTVVEVGLDIPGVELMTILHAERLGLASLHQLRGRLARGNAAKEGFCQLFCANPDSFERLKFLETAADGFQVAALDLRQRGPGAMLGTRQHGKAGFQAFDPLRDDDLVALLRHKELRNWLADPE
ncbi:MAG: DEAD/DEAH box helicase [Planctomycetes bacterium]|nr:DEAD/DEAH box helicase [Planctomycetota bacterium]MCP4771941.1 DEAD/DEAH box helicase [Planctomycetota bacterium]MCP4860408.1 DEAD/DEAH box helicase [Planctomycetota bacterium]